MSDAPNMAYPVGVDYTRAVRQDDIPDPRMAELIRASAFGRAKGRLIQALSLDDPLEREARVDELLAALIDFALEGADARTILLGLSS